MNALKHIVLYFKWSRTIFVLGFLFFKPWHSTAGQFVVISDLHSSTILEVEIIKLDENQLINSRPSPILQLFRKKRHENRRLTAALLAFPFPFGIVGLHRIYLGTAPSVPVVYIATLGGVFGLLPFIDCCVLLFDKDVKQYDNNKKVFMWIR